MPELSRRGGRTAASRNRVRRRRIYEASAREEAGADQTAPAGWPSRPVVESEPWDERAKTRLQGERTGRGRPREERDAREGNRRCPFLALQRLTRTSVD